MKFKSTILVAALTALSFTIPACDGGGEEKKEEEKADEKAEEKTEEKAEEKTEEKAEEKAEGEGDAAGDGSGTGIAECDELWKRNMCVFDKMPSGADEARKAFEQAAQSWKDLAGNEATKQAAADACKQALTAGDEAWKAQGC